MVDYFSVEYKTFNIVSESLINLEQVDLGQHEIVFVSQDTSIKTCLFFGKNAFTCKITFNHVI